MPLSTPVPNAVSTPRESFLERWVLNQTGHKNMLHLIHLRWLAVAGQIITVVVATTLLGIRLPMPQMLAVLVCLIAFNIASHLRWHEEDVASNRAVFLALLVDVTALSLLLYFSGGTNNPFAFLFLLQVILGAVLLRSSSAWFLMLVTTWCMAALSVVHHPLELPPARLHMMPSLYLQGLLICFVLIAVLLVFFISRISANLRAGDLYLADLRQRAAEEDHIVRMGLLASGAAHELGTPLATMAVIVNDWASLPALQADATLREDMAELQSQILRCKSIVSGILMSAGETRGESTSRTTLRRFVNDLAQDWQIRRSPMHFEVNNELDDSVQVVSDSALRQSLSNLLDNAQEACPHWVGLTARVRDSQVVLTIEDRGPGFPQEVIAQFGRPYNSTKGKPGGGLGLFLVLNVVRTLGGQVLAGNRSEGGARVELVLPLSAIALGEPLHDEFESTAQSVGQKA